MVHPIPIVTAEKLANLDYHPFESSDNKISNTTVS